MKEGVEGINLSAEVNSLFGLITSGLCYHSPAIEAILLYKIGQIELNTTDLIISGEH